MKKGYYENESITVLSDGTVLWRGDLYQIANDNHNNTITGDIRDFKSLVYIPIKGDKTVL